MVRYLVTALLIVALTAVVLAGYAPSTIVPPSNPLNDPDLPGYVASMTTMEAGSLIIPMGTLQGNMSSGVHRFNFPAYGLIAHLLWHDIPLYYSLKSGKTATTDIDFSVSTLQAWPPVSPHTTTPQVRDFDGGSYIVEAKYAQYAWPIIKDYVHGAGRLERLQTNGCETYPTVIYNATTSYEIPVRHFVLSKPFISVMDSSSKATVQLAYLKQAGFLWGQHYKQMNYDEANSLSSETCVTFISEPHFEPGYPEARSFQDGMRQFVNAGGNFLSQCGGVSTYEQCDLDRDSPPDLQQCPGGFFVTTDGFRINPATPSSSFSNFVPDTQFAQYIGSWTYKSGSILSFGLWNTLTSSATRKNTTLNTANAGHFVVGGIASDEVPGYAFVAAHGKLQKFHGKIGGNIFYLAGHEYRNNGKHHEPSGMRLWLNAALHMSNRTGCKATVTLPDGTVKIIGELTIDPCRYGGDGCNRTYDCSFPHRSGSYKEGWDYGVELLAGDPLTMQPNVTLPNRLATLAILDAFNFPTVNKQQVLETVHALLPYLWDLQPKFNKFLLAEAYSTSSSPYYARRFQFTSQRNAAASQSAPSSGSSSTNRILNTLLAALQDNVLLWDGSIRVIHVYTYNAAPSSVPSGLISNMTSLKIPIVIAVPDQSIKAGYDSLNLPRTTVVVVNYPTFKPNGASPSTLITGANALFGPVITAQNALLQSIPLSLKANTDPLALATAYSSATLSLDSQASTDLTLTAIADQAVTFTLPGTYGTPGGSVWAPMPYTIKWAVGGTDIDLVAAIFWNDYATAVPVSPPAFYEGVDTAVDVISRIRLSASTTNHNALFLEVLNITKDGVDVWDTDFASVHADDGTEMVRGEYYRTDAIWFKTNSNKYGEYMVHYRFYDRCVRSESTIPLTVLYVNDPPTGSNFTYLLKPGEIATIEWFNPTDKLADQETPKTSLKVSFDVVSITNSGVLQVFVDGAWTNAVAKTQYDVSIAVRFQSSSQGTVNASFPYSVWDSDGAKNVVPVFANFQFTHPPNKAPVISLIPSTTPTLTTAQTSTATFKVNVTDYYEDLTSKIRVESIGVQWADVTSLRPVTAIDSRDYALFNSILSGDVLLPSVALTRGTTENSVVFDFTWTPAASAPFGASFSFVLFAEDPEGLISNKVTVTLTTPLNSPPTVIGFTSPDANPTYAEVNSLTSRELHITLNDPNAIHKEKLNLTFVTLPHLGVLYRQDCTTRIQVGDIITFTQGIPTPEATVIPVCYIQNAYVSGTDNFTVFATDLAGSNSAEALLQIELTPVNWPPVSANVTRQSSGNPVPFTLTATDPDGDPLTLFILETDLEKGTVTYGPESTTLVAGATFPPTTGLNWAQDFTYTPTPNIGDHVAHFTFRYEDPHGASSPIYFAIINISGSIVLIPPEGTDFAESTPEDVPLVINFDDKIYDEDSIPGQIIITTLPPHGTLFGPNSNTLTPGSIVDRSSNGSLIITYAPPPNWNGETTFTYQVVDNDGLTSDIHTVTVTVIPVNDPPVISASPTSITVARGETGTFDVSLSDIDSATITLVVAAGNTVPALSTLSSNTWTLSGTAQSSVITVNNPNPGEKIPVTIEWTPSTSLPDGSVGTFTIFAVDTENLESNARPILEVKVVPNEPPTLVSTYQYEFTVEEDSFTDLQITLAGTDPQEYHREVLDVILDTLPEGVTLTQNGASLTPGMVLSSTGANGETVATVSAASVSDWYGDASFTFYVRDLLGLVSEKQIVIIHVAPMNDPPTTEDVTLVVQEDTCFSSEVACPKFVPVTVVPFVTITGTDPEEDGLAMQFTTLPVSGKLFYLNGGVLEEVTSTDKVFTGASGWQFYYEPAAKEHSECVDKLNPSADTCDDFATLPFEVKDGSATATGIFHIIVLPLPDPPTGEDLTFTINEDETLTIVLPAHDIDDEPATLIVKTTGIATWSKGSLHTTDQTTIPMNDEVAVGADKSVIFVPFPNDFSGATTPYARFYYKVVDPSGQESPEYTVTIYVLPVADELVPLGPESIRIPEDTNASMILGKEGQNWVSADSGQFYLILTSIPERGTLFVCVSGTCQLVTEEETEDGETVPLFTSITPEAQFVYQPPPDEFGEDYAIFTYQMVLKPEGLAELTIVNRTFTIHIDPVNDPPVLIPRFALAPNETAFDEDTTGTLYFEATDIDTPLEELRAFLINGLGTGVPLEVYSCLDSSDQEEGCADGPKVNSSGILFSIAPGQWALGLVPPENVNGRTRFTFSVSDGELSSESVTAPIWVRPINDAPVIVRAEVIPNADGEAFGFAFDVTDPDFMFKNVRITLNDLSGNGTFYVQGRNLTDVPSSDYPCYQEASSSLTCELLLSSLESWAHVIFYQYTAEDGVATDLTRQIEFIVNDLGNVDYRPDMNLQASTILNVSTVLDALVAKTTPRPTNTGLIAGAVGGLLGGALLFALIAFFLRKKSTKAVEQYFDRMALDTEGASHASPLYQGATKGGESVLYRAANK